MKVLVMTSLAAVLVLSGVILGLANGDCDTEFLPRDHVAVVAATECVQIHGKDRLINEKGEYQVETVESMLAAAPKEPVVDALREIWARCAKSGKAKPIDRTMPKCTGYMKMAKCARKVMLERCPNIVKMLEP